MIAATGPAGLVGLTFGLFSRGADSIAGVTDTMMLGALVLLFLALVVVVVLRSDFGSSS